MLLGPLVSVTHNLAIDPSNAVVHVYICSYIIAVVFSGIIPVSQDIPYILSIVSGGIQIRRGGGGGGGGGG